MINLEKVIKGLENCLHYKGHCLECPYNSSNCQNDVLNDALILLKEQENASKRNPVIICPHCGRRLDRNG